MVTPSSDILYPSKTFHASLVIVKKKEVLNLAVKDILQGNIAFQQQTDHKETFMTLHSYHSFFKIFI